ncbi:hypothetical protein [Streptomyces broussonetiae]|nr:hypothetical protein [Streptomyces broussonetiae]
MSKTQRKIRVVLARAAAVVMGLLLAGCAHSSSDARSLPGGVSDASASRTSAPEHADALAAYRAMWHDLAVASRTSDASSPLLDDHARGGALELLKYGLSKSKKERVVSKGAPRVDPQVVSATDQKVVLVDCVDDRNWLQYKLNGELKNDVPGGHYRTDATVRRNNGFWKVTDLYMHEAGSC